MIYMKIYDGTDDRRVFPTTHTVAVVSSDRLVCNGGDRMTIRKNGREDWSLFYCEAGRMYIEQTIVEAGQAWIYAPGVPQQYIVYSKDQTVYRYLHFTGNDISALLSSLQIPLSVVLDVKGNLVANRLEGIRNSLKDDSALSVLEAECHALRLISALAQQCTVPSEMHLLKRVTDHMEHTFDAPFSAEHYAAMMYVSVGRFNHLFKERVGVSPYTYYMRLRISNACNLLEETTLPIKEVATLCGYRDPVFFTQAFRKEMKMTPTAYRRATMNSQI